MVDTSKIMSIRPDAFALTLGHLELPTLRAQGPQPEVTSFTVDVDDGAVEIMVTELPSDTLGGLLVLPRARVDFTFNGLSDEQSSRFMARFDIAFRRGGG